MKRDPNQSGDQLNAFLKAGDPVEPSALSGDGVESALDEMGAEITGRSRQASPRWTRRLSMSKPRAALVIGFATIGIGAAVAGGSQLGAHTGEYSMYPYGRPTPEEIAKASPEQARRLKGLKRLVAHADAVGPSEDLNPAAPDFRDVAIQVGSDIPWPDGYASWRNFQISLLSQGAGGAENVRVTSLALRGRFAQSAFCAWVMDWRQAGIAGDTDAVATATRVISEAPSWKAVTDEDPHPDPTVVGDGGFIQGTLFGWMLPFRDAVLAGNRARVENLLVAGSYDRGSTCEATDPDWFAIYGRHARDSSWTDNKEQHYRQYLASRTS